MEFKRTILITKTNSYFTPPKFPESHIARNKQNIAQNLSTWRSLFPYNLRLNYFPFSFTKTSKAFP